MTVLVVYGDPQGPARGPALRLTRSLRRLGTPARTRAAGRVVRLDRASALVVALDRAGADEIAELLESFGLPAAGLPVFALRVDDVEFPGGVRTLPGTRGDGVLPRDPGAVLRSASGLAVELRRATPAARTARTLP